MSNLRRALERFEKKKKERDEMVAKGLESYPVRLYEVIVEFKEEDRIAHQSYYACGYYETIEADKKYIAYHIDNISKTVKFASKLDGRNLNIKLIDIKLIKEQ